MRIFRDQELFKHRAPISKIISSDEHCNWDKSYYHFSSDYLVNERMSYNSCYPIMLTPKR